MKKVHISRQRLHTTIRFSVFFVRLSETNQITTSIKMLKSANENETKKKKKKRRKQ